MYLRISLFFLSMFSFVVIAKPVSDFFPKHQDYIKNIITPEQSLDFELGIKHPRYHQIQSYFETLATQSNRIKLTQIGKTYQQRDQILLTISSEQNLANLTSIINNRQLPYKSQENEPLIIWLGYSVHGNELTGVNAAMAVAYHLAASQSKKVEEILANTIVVIEPSLNPDGLDRYVSWLETFGALNANLANADPQHIEHQGGWPSGRTNHFWFDLNRDWLLLSQQETKNRLAYYHLYQPHVLGDYHEMSPDKTYFFQPGVTTRTHPLTPENTIKLTNALSVFHAKALDSKKRLYFTQEGYDDFFYGKGSTYPDINAGVGILFEQASSKGLAHETVNGLLTFQFGIENNIFTSMSTIEGAWANRIALKKHRASFYQEIDDLVDDEEFDGYLIHEKNDKYRFNAFLELLKQHQIKAYPLNENFELNDDVFEKNSTFYIPLNQPKYRMIKALFNQQKTFKDNSFYDISGWTLPLAMNITTHAIEKTRGLKLAKTPWQKKAIFELQTPVKSYAYAISWQDYLAPKVLNKLLNYGVKVKVAKTEFSINNKGELKTFKRGTLLISSGQQIKANWLTYLYATANESELSITPISSGATKQGIDIGSPSMSVLSPVKVLLVGDNDISQYEAGEMRFYLEHSLDIPLTIIEKTRLNQVDLAHYTHIILVDGNYHSFDETTVNKLRSYLENGGVIFGQKHGAKWLADSRLLKARFASRNSILSMYQDDELTFQQRDDVAAKQRIAGAIFETSVDLSHPLTFGYDKNTLPVFKNNTLILEKINMPFSKVLSYTKKPLLSGYTDQKIVDRISEEPMLAAHRLGKGRVIASSDNLLFRGYWLGTNKIVANSLFFAKVFE